MRIDSGAGGWSAGLPRRLRFIPVPGSRFAPLPRRHASGPRMACQAIAGAAAMWCLFVLTYGPVVKLQVVAGMGFPPASTMPEVSPAVNRVFAASVAPGSRVTTRVRVL